MSSRKYSDEEDKWLLENVDIYSFSELVKLFNEKFNRNNTKGSIRSHMINTLNCRKRNTHIYTKEEDEWLNHNFSSFDSYEDLLNHFNKQFKCSLKYHSIVSHCSKILNLHFDVFHKFTIEEDEWIREHLDENSYGKLVKQFNFTFGTQLSYNSFTSHVLKQLKLKKTVNTGNVKKGERRCTNILPIGSESFDGNNVYVKIADNINDCKDRRMPTKHKDPNWKRKDYIVWEEAGNRLPQDSSEMLIHLNTDKYDCSIDNLYLTTRKINFMMAKNGWYSKNRDLTLTGIKWCELFYAIKEAKHKTLHKSV